MNRKHDYIFFNLYQINYLQTCGRNCKSKTIGQWPHFYVLKHGSVKRCLLCTTEISCCITC